MRLHILFAVMLVATSLSAQTEEHPEDRQVDMDDPTFVPTVKVGKVLDNGDSIQYMEMNNVYVYPNLTFKNSKQAAAYNRLVKNVKTVLPIAKEVNQIIVETYEYLETLRQSSTLPEQEKSITAAVVLI